MKTLRKEITYNSHKGRIEAKKVCVYNKNKECIAVFPSLRFCSREMKIAATTLSKAIQENKTIKGYSFKFE